MQDANIITMFSGLDVDGDGCISLKDLDALLGPQEGYSELILAECEVEPAAGLEFADYFRVVCGYESQLF